MCISSPCWIWLLQKVGKSFYLHFLFLFPDSYHRNLRSAKDKEDKKDISSHILYEKQFFFFP